MPSVKLNNGHVIPTPGIGTFTLNLELVRPSVKYALDAGFRHFDTAARYGNEKEIGEELKEAFDKNIVRREDVFVVSKLWSNKHRKEDVKPELMASLKRLQLDFLDLYLIHWPMSFKSGQDAVPVDDHGNALFEDIPTLETWKAMEECVQEGLVKSIGLSNFNSLQITDLLKHCKIKPAVLQVEMHPYLQQHKLLNFCKQHSIVLTAYSPLASPARPWVNKSEVPMLQDPVLTKIAEKKAKSPAQVVLRWLDLKEVVPLPKSNSQERIKQNFDIFDFDLSDEELQEISKLERNFRTCTPKDFHSAQVDWSQVNKYPFSAEF